MAVEKKGWLIMFTKVVKYQSFLKMSLSGVAGSGKAQPLDAKILTPTGWRLIGDVRIGDAIINSQGSVSCVLGVYPQGKKEIYRVTLSDGSSTECCDDHLWRTQTYLDRLASFKRPETVKRDGTVKPLHEIRKTLKHGDRANHYLPMIKAIEFEEQVPLAIDPYVFGVLLGDGCFQEKCVQLSNPEPFIQEYVREHLPDGLVLKLMAGSSYDFMVSRAHMTTRNNPIVVALREDGLTGKKSTQKFIPDRYKFASVEHRSALLQGLLDTDGHAHGCSLEYSSSSPKLAQDVQFLVESLGGKAHMAEKTPHYTHRGEYREGALSYRLHISLPPDVAPFRLPRKASQYIPRSKYLPARSIQEVTFVGVKPAQCIAVDAPDQLYVTDHCIVTHNTYTSLTLATALADGQGVALIDTEHGSASLYADLFGFDVLELDTFHPQKFIDAIAEAEQAGYAVLVIDSLSHAWNGKGGLLDVVDNIAVRKYKGNSFNAWKDAGLIQNALVETILTANLHILVTLRSKMDHVQEKNEQTGKNEVKKLGMAPIQRDGVEYELDVIADLDVLNTMVIQKSRYRALSGLVIPKPDGRLVTTIKQGLAGVPRPQVQAVVAPPSTPSPVATVPASTPAPTQPSVPPVETPALPQATPGQSTAQEMITEQQRSSIEKICAALGQPTPLDYEQQTYTAAKETIQRLTALYRQAQQAKREKKAS